MTTDILRGTPRLKDGGKAAIMVVGDDSSG